MTANHRAEIRAKIAENDETIERLANAACAQKAATGAVVRDLEEKLRRLSLTHNATRESPLPSLPLPNGKHDND